jgi:hypothetical protein
MAPD